MRIFDFIHPVQTVGAAAVGVGAVGSAFRPAKHFALAAGLAAALAAGGVVAVAAPNAEPIGEVEYVSLPFGRTKLPYQALFERISAEDQSLDAFMLALAPQMRDYTAQTGYEACAAIATDGVGHYGVVVGTNFGHSACVVFNSRVPAGMRPIGLTVHSHPEKQMFVVNQTDLVTLSNVTLGQRKHGLNPDKFSTIDMQSPGYLVGTQNLLYQRGRRTVRIVGTIDNVDGASVAANTATMGL